LDGRSTHFCLIIPMNSCSPTNAKTLRQKRVKIITSDSFFTDWISAPTIVFRPVQNRVHLVTCQLYTNVIRVQNSLQTQIFDSDYEVELFNSCFHVWQTAQVIETSHTRDSSCEKTPCCEIFRHLEMCKSQQMFSLRFNNMIHQWHFSKGQAIFLKIQLKSCNSTL